MMFFIVSKSDFFSVRGKNMEIINSFDSFTTYNTRSNRHPLSNSVAATCKNATSVFCIHVMHFEHYILITCYDTCV